MRVRCHLRTIRGPRSLRSIANEAGVNPGMLSRIEQGVAFPKDSEIEPLQEAYKASLIDWYEPWTLLALEFEDDQLDDLRMRLYRPLQGMSSDG